MDGDETDVDCGGKDCSPCPQGKHCLSGSDCATGACVDAYCCESSCTDASNPHCVSCGLPGKQGLCTPVPKSVDVLNCAITATCDGVGECLYVPGLGHFGKFCTQDADCYNHTCAGGYCKLADGDPCNDDVACRTGRCAANVCTPCTVSTQCASNVCNVAVGACALPGGAPCAADTDCAEDSCTADQYCDGPATPCVPSECKTHFCSSGSCVQCMSGDPCPLGTACTAGECLAPLGAYCESGAYCASGACGPAAFLSVPRCH
jgi:hypothetical protein